jgi:hypothetical protein
VGETKRAAAFEDKPELGAFGCVMPGRLLSIPATTGRQNAKEKQ